MESVHRRRDAEDRLASLNRQFRPALVAFFLRRLGNHAEAEDLTQDVFVRLAASDAVEMQSAEAYIFRVAANLISDRARRERVRAEYRGEVSLDPATGIEPRDPSRIAQGRESLTAVAGALASLPDRTREIFILYRLENVEKHKIGELFHMPLSTIDKHLARAMAHVIRKTRGKL